ncbi:hypothetical protein [Acholeplasma laidlawii]|uniref:Uncharacterized protein n=2 Tax=Acholeplasma laidlawii TaxID=2148 RepID=A9NHL4_ACHLI|nr:hypothetical protein [Acholeplasma laidlawii]ABX81844.1 hypothetical protein ACL_1245 [Acholeplasma laidlawii PG-8A]NWH12215.1 hypothetical protein [Acholeplasma laidlawii]NWH13601.1 hypothetical protein [Acholeplasma laidlawii]NWH14232.1 hypothetical protein [Acholeplasma laidlawii]OAN20161.1 hypothetical protein A2I99_02350 [Acholeplasma laidlawii]
MHLSSDDSVLIRVPKHLVVSTHEHPEPYGEAIVVLVNGMYTDVYTKSDGEYYTTTNDDDLIAYLKQFLDEPLK